MSRIRLMKGVLILATLAALVVFFCSDLLTRKGKPNSLPKARQTQQMAQEPTASPVKQSDEHQMKVLALALQKKPGHTPVLLQLAQLESQKGKLADARGHLEEILRSEPGNQQARLELGRVLFQLGDVQGAISQTEEILKAHPSDPDALYNLGAIYGNLGNRERAEEYWKRLLTAAPESDSGKRARQMMTQLEAGIH